jgi:type IV fimbrial biogenesis protein FimT
MHRRNGFTLIELLVAIVIFAIAVGVAIPGFRGLIQSNQAVTQANELLTALQLARSEAVRRGVPVTVCASATVTESDSGNVVCSGATDWSTGWIVFEDSTTADGSRTTASEPLIHVFSALSGEAQMASTGGAFIRFGRDGAYEAGSRQISHSIPDSNIAARVLCVELTGRAEIRQGSSC